MMRRSITFFILCVACALSALANGEQSGRKLPTLSSRIVADSVGIGDRIVLEVDVEKDLMQELWFPEFELGGDNPLEQVSNPTLDTLQVDGRRVKLRRRYHFTTFEAGNYNLGRISILSRDRGVVDTLHCADSMRFFVGTFLIDSTSHTPFDIKPIRTLPFKFREISGYVLWSVLALLLLVGLALLVLYIMSRLGRPVMGIFKPAPPVPPHVAALAALEDLHSARLWQEGDYKSYYSSLTDILRTYISGRYGVAAMEMTSDEIIAAARELELPKQCEMQMRDLLRDADLVKFAKAQYAASVNEGYFDSTRQFVDLTKEVEESEDDKKEEE